MRQKVIATLLTFLLSVSAKPILAQKSNPNPGKTQASITQEFIESQMYEANKGISSNREVEGSPYYHEDWTPGYFIKTNDRATASYPMRFNINKNQLEFKFDENTLYIASPKPIKGFVLTPKDGPIVTFKQGFKIPDEAINKKTFLQVIHDGETKLLLHHHNRLRKGHSQDMFTGKYVDEYVSKSQYYIIDEDGKAERVKLKEKDLIKNLKKKNVNWKSYIRENNLNLKKEEDVVRFLVEYDRHLVEPQN